ncbi:RNA polymerase sigma factor [Vulcaniibacterium gelatinicum]|uniref:RNA polymerase sigma factor n=1 Tax=Vulcaniibacterium gelatinicum TaxID=2598725 RepID=UPI0011CB15B2|nr:sigma-70 family RNA polymerase sigma factor [Vulcaniibacterium gelatinicum]
MRTAPDPLEIARQVRDARAGSQAAFAWLYRAFAPLVHAIHLGMAPRAQAEELVQETFAQAFARLATLREPQRFGPWIAAIARHNVPAPRAPLDTLDDEHHVASADAGPDDAAEAARVMRAIRTLPPAYRETLALRLVEGYGGPEIAALTGLSPGSVRVNLHRGMARLRAALGVAADGEEVDDVAT